MSDKALDRIVSVIIILSLIILYWVIEIIDLALLPDFRLDAFGIYPRYWFGLFGIATAPFLHGGYGHVFSNSIGLLIFGTLLILQNRPAFWVVFFMTSLTSGLGVWLIGRTGVHLGASGMIFGLYGYLIATAFFERSWWSILRTCLLLFFFGSLLWGIFPTEESISWEGHFFGLLGGIWIASETWG